MVNIMAHRTGIYFNDEEYEKIKYRASEYHMSFGKFVKNAALENKIKIRQTTDPSLIRELGYVGNNLNQIAKALNILKNKNGEIELSQMRELNALLKDLSSTVKKAIVQL